MNDIKARREALGITQAELARRVGTTVPTIWRYEHGQREPSATMLLLLAKALNCEPEELVRELYEKVKAELTARGSISPQPHST